MKVIRFEHYLDCQNRVIKWFRGYCADKTVPITKRWALFCDAPDELKNKEMYIIHPEQDLDFIDDISWYDDFRVAKFETYYLDNNFIEQAQEAFNLTSAQIQQLQEWILERCLGSFVYDW